MQHKLLLPLVIMKRIYTLFAILLVIEIILAIICGPHSCEWGNSVYFYFGIFSLAVSFILALLQKEWPLGKRIGYGFLFLLVSVIVWCAGFMLCGFSIICRLF